MTAKEKKIISRYKKQGGRIGVVGKVTLRKREDFSLWYTPGVGAAASHMAKHGKDVRAMSVKKNSVAVVSDGSAVLGLGNIGPWGALPVMEGKALIFRELGGIDAWPIVLDTQDEEKIIETAAAIAPAFGGINLEDFAAPKCFRIEEEVKRRLDIPVMHDDQHGTAIVVLAGLLNAAKVVKKEFKKLRVVISGAGAAGTAIAKLLLLSGIKDIIVLDSKGIIMKGREALTPHKVELARTTNPRGAKGSLDVALEGADAFVGVSGPNLMQAAQVFLMGKRAIVFALANPTPEIMPEEAKKGGAAVVATGRSDFPNQINNALVFPGVFRGALDRGVSKITDNMKLRAAKNLAALVAHPTAENIVPKVLDTRVVPVVAKAIR